MLTVSNGAVSDLGALMDLDGEALLMLSDDIPAGLKQPKLYQSHHAPAVVTSFLTCHLKGSHW